MQTFSDFRRQFELGIERFLNGDPTLWKSNVSREADGTLMGGWGREQGDWKLLHRHADPLMNKTAPADVLSR
jgi:hypothetical protein